MFSKVLRRTHMYLALFLAPWVAMYAVSTMVMNHRGLFVGMYGRGPAPFEKIREVTYPGEFADGTSSEAMTEAILRNVGLEGAHNSPMPRPDGTLVFQRQDILRPYRITYTPPAGTEAGKVLVERARFQWNSFMGTIHRRRGYQQPYALDDAWGFIVDLFIVATVVWALSGLWMWWEMKVTRKWGAVSLGAGAALFAFFLVRL
ncbi:MAG TPA: PepSY-associated TM helix domain-containing protein [Bryobacteraceae bacterium]|jgi:hypothetical protein|nr:PepSY-associated TM helix domain-containing protein [Bryobacteraceae bacterium]